MLAGITAHRIVPAPPVATSYTNPGGSGDRTATVGISKSGFSSSGALTLLINGGFENTFWFTSTSAVAGHWIKFDFGSPKVIQGIHINQQNTVGSGTWRLEGSNDDVNWTPVSPNFTWPMNNAAFDFTNNTGSFRYWRIFGISGNFNNAPFQQEIRFKISA